MNNLFPSWLVYAVAASVGAALLLVLGFCAYWFGQGGNDAASLRLPAADFTAVQGKARLSDGRLKIVPQRQSGGERRAVVSLWRAVNSDDFRFVSVEVDEVGPDHNMTLFWRRAGAPDSFQSRTLPGSVPGTITLDMDDNADWSGYLTEIGLLITSGTGSEPLYLTGLQLESSSLQAAAASVLTQWRGFRTFDQTTVNGLRSSFSSIALSPVLVAAAFAAIAMGLLAIFAVAGKSVPATAFAAVLLLAWVQIDLLWQGQLDSRRDQVRHLFSGQDMPQRHERDVDSEYYQHASALWAGGLPEEPARLFILHDSVRHNYQRLKMQYYLLPHNIFNYGMVPPAGVLRSGDYVLALGDLNGFEFDESAQVISWGASHQLPARLEHRHRLGRLFLITGSESGPDIPHREVTRQ